MQTLILYRGLPGSGKSTLAQKQAEDVGGDSVVLEADRFFELNPMMQYAFNKRLLPTAHGWCQGETRWSLSEGQTMWVGVANTFSQMWEMEPYVEIANQFKLALAIIDLFDVGFDDEQLARRCVHNVPAEAIAKMRARWEKVTLTCVDQVYSLELINT